MSTEPEPTPLQRLPIGAIKVTERLRQFNEAQIEALKGSIAELGLLTPISVYLNEQSGDYEIVAGVHRLEACRRLGWPEIDAFVVVHLGDWDRQLWEIDENLMRAELSEGERGEHLLRRKQIYEAKREQARGENDLAGTNSPTKPQHETGFASETAEHTGLTKRHINRSIRRAERIAPDVRETIRTTPTFHKGVELDALAELAHDDQRRAIAMVHGGHARTFREARDRLLPRQGLPDTPQPTEKNLKSLRTAWKTADADARLKFLAELGLQPDATPSPDAVTGEAGQEAAGQGA